MKKFIVFILFLFISVCNAQDKYLIYFKDKDILPTENLSKSNPIYKSAISLLSEKSINRRIKNMGKDIITFEDLPIREDYISQIEDLGIKIDKRLKWFNAVSSYLTENQKAQVLGLPFIEKIEYVRKFKFRSPETDTPPIILKQSAKEFLFDYGQSFGQLQLSDILAVHTKGITGEGVLLGLLDTGFNWKNHESLNNANVVAEYDFIFNDMSTENDSLDVSSQHNHGTLVFSIVGGFKDSVLIGSTFGSDFILAKTEDVRSEKHIEEDNYAAALEWMENFGVDITSSSLGYSTFDPGEFSYNYSDMDGKTTIVTRAAELAFRRGVLTVTSAGNEGDTPWFYITAPADGVNTLGIGAVNNENQVAGFSSRGPSYDGRIKPDLVARGVGVFGANAGNFSGYTTASGTSVAAPIASGIAALLLSAYPHLSNLQLRNILIETGDNSLSPNNERGYGLISAVRAIEFPNLKYSDDTYILYKRFLTNENIQPQSLNINYSINGSELIIQQMNYDDSLKFDFRLPYLFNGDLVSFYFTYSDNGNLYVDGYYKFYYGSLDISLNLSPQVMYSDYVVSEPYPNPFYPMTNIFTSIAIKSSGGEIYKIRVIDALGQQVSYQTGTTIEGINRIDWYGKNDRSSPLASGTYYFLIDFGGQQISRKVVLLR